MKSGASSIPPMQTLLRMPQLKDSWKKKRKCCCNFYLEFDCFIASCPPGEGVAKKKTFCVKLWAWTAFWMLLKLCPIAPGRGKGCSAPAPKPNISPSRDYGIPPSKYQDAILITAHPWSTQVWTAWVHLHMDFFQSIHWKFFWRFVTIWEFVTIFSSLACFW